MSISLQKWFCVIALVLCFIQKDSKADELLSIYYENNDIPKLTDSRIDELKVIVSNHVADLSEVYAIWCYLNHEHLVWLDVLYTPIKVEGALFKGKRSEVRNRRQNENLVEQGYLYEAQHGNYWVVIDDVSAESSVKSHPLKLIVPSEYQRLIEVFEYNETIFPVKIEDIVAAYNLVRDLIVKANTAYRVPRENIYSRENKCLPGSVFNNDKLALKIKRKLLYRKSQIMSPFYNAYILAIEMVSSITMDVRIGYTWYYKYGTMTFRLEKQNNEWVVVNIPEWWGYGSSGDSVLEN